MRIAATFRDLEWSGDSGPNRIAGALERLDGEARLVLALLFVEGLNEAETAAALDRSVDHVRALAGDALVALRSTAAGADARRAA